MVWYLQCFLNYSCIQIESNKNWRQKVPKIAQNSYRSALKRRFLKTEIHFSLPILIIKINPLNPELNPICYLLALLAHHFLHVSRIMVKSLPLRLLMSYTYGAHILDVSRSHTTTHHSRYDSSGRVISSSQRPLPDNTRHSQQTNIHAPGGIRTHDLSRRAAANLRLRPRGHWDRLKIHIKR